MGKKADRRAARIEAALQSEADDLWRSRWIREWAAIGEEAARRAGAIPYDRPMRRSHPVNAMIIASVLSGR